MKSYFSSIFETSIEDLAAQRDNGSYFATGKPVEGHSLEVSYFSTFDVKLEPEKEGNLNGRPALYSIAGVPEFFNSVLHSCSMAQERRRTDEATSVGISVPDLKDTLLAQFPEVSAPLDLVQRHIMVIHWYGRLVSYYFASCLFSNVERRGGHVGSSTIFQKAQKEDSKRCDQCRISVLCLSCLYEIQVVPCV
jgi:hypothetical protein